VSISDEQGVIDFVTSQRWYGSKTRSVNRAEVLDRAVLRVDEPTLELQLVDLRFDTGTHESYQLVVGDSLDALDDPRGVRELVHMIRSGARIPAEHGIVEFVAADGFAEAGHELRDARVVSAEQSNSSIVFDEELILKVFRRLSPGINPELELLRFLTDHRFANIAPLAGWYAYQGEPIEATLGILQRFVSGGIDGWELTLDTMADQGGGVLPLMRRLGEVTGEMHTTPASSAVRSASRTAVRSANYLVRRTHVPVHAQHILREEDRTGRAFGGARTSPPRRPPARQVSPTKLENRGEIYEIEEDQDSCRAFCRLRRSDRRCCVGG